LIPRVGLVCDRGVDDGLQLHRVNDAYIAAVRDGAGALPLLIPALNVALGGTLHQHVAEQPGRMIHFDDESLPLETQWGPAHALDILPGGFLARIAGTGSVTVNSLHPPGHRPAGRAAAGRRHRPGRPDRGRLHAGRTRFPAGGAVAPGMELGRERPEPGDLHNFLKCLEIT